MDSPVSKTDASKEKFVASKPSTADSKTMKGCGLANLTWVGVDKVELRQRLMMPEYLRLAMRDCIKRKDSSAIPEHLLLPGGAVADMAPHAPMVVFINPKSGGRHGPVLKERLQQLMSEEQVFDLTEVKPHEFVQYGLACLETVAAEGDECAKECRARLRIMVAGGDGTVGWVLGCLGGLNEEGRLPIPPVGVIPLGTGNDLSRSFGWGGSFPFAWRSAVKRTLHRASMGPVARLDSWKILVSMPSGEVAEPPYSLKPTEENELDQGLDAGIDAAPVAKSYEGVFYNYLSIGMDAQVAYGFHHLRNTKPYLAQGPISNKIIYSGFGCNQGWFCTPCVNDPGLRLIVVLNMETIVPHSETIGNPTIVGETDTEIQRPLSAPGNIPPSSRVVFSEPTIQHSVNKAPPRGVNILNPVNSNPSFRPSVQPSYQPPASYRNHGPIMKNEAPARIIPINALNPYQGRWAIKARVTAKGDIRRYNNAKGDGKVFSFDLLDSDGGEIRVTCFNAVVDRFYDVTEVGKVYLISKGSLKPAQKNFNHLKNEWEIFLESTSTVELCPDEDGSIPRQQFSFRPISDIENAENNTILDVIGVVTSVNPSVPILRKNGMETHRRILNLKDESGKAVEVTLWGEFCNRDGRQLEDMVDSAFHPVLAIKAGKVSDFSGKSVGTISSTQLFINPDFPEAHRLRNWFDQGGKDTASFSISRDTVPGGGSRNEIRKNVSQIKEEGLGRSDKPDWITVKATVSFIKTDSFCYTACPLMIGDKQCNKKVTRSGTNRWLCDRCNQESDECDYRYLLQVQIQDHTGLTWVTAFQETGEEIMGCPAKKLYALKYELEKEEEFAEIVKERLFHQYMLKLKIKEESYGDEQRVKMTVVKVDKVNYTSESKYLLGLLVR